MAVVARWEWRTFGEHFGAAGETFAEIEPERIQESDELYLLSERGGDTVKVRDELMDVKHLERVNDDGLEQWLPVLKAPFPLSAGDVASVFGALHVDVPPFARTAYSAAELLDEVVHRNGDLLPVSVHKVRRRYMIRGCMAELTDVRTEHASTRTIAIESEDAARVLETVRALGLAVRPNVNYPRGLREIVSRGAARSAVIDVGTNSVKFHIGERSAGGSWRTLVDRAEVTRLGKGLDASGRLDPDAVERTAEAIAGMVKQANDCGARAIAAVGTAGLRVASNSGEFVEAAKARSGVDVEIISGEEEGRLAYLAATSELGMRQGALVVFDSGGGSSQFTFGHDGDVEDRFSLDVGAVRVTERYGLDSAVSRERLARALEGIAHDLGRLDGRPRPDAVVGMGGTVTNLAAVKHALATYDPDVVQGTVLDRPELERQLELYRSCDSGERRSIVGLQPARAEIILGGACIVRTVLEMLGAESLTVSDRGLRHGLLVDRFG